MQKNSSSERVQLGDDIHVWQAWLDRDPEVVKRLESLLSSDEIARANRFRFEKDKNHYIVARGLLRELLGRYLGEPPAGLEFSYGTFGKPALAGNNTSSGLSFNLSHSAGLAVYAFAMNRNLGIDVERIRPDFVSEDIARRYFSSREVSNLFTLPPEKRPEAFFQCWTRKEAYIKARGAGLQIPLNSFSVSFLDGQRAEFLAGVDPCWHLAAFTPAENYPMAVAYDGAPAALRFGRSGAQPVALQRQIWASRWQLWGCEEPVSEPEPRRQAPEVVRLGYAEDSALESAILEGIPVHAPVSAQIAAT